MGIEPVLTQKLVGYYQQNISLKIVIRFIDGKEEPSTICQLAI